MDVTDTLRRPRPNEPDSPRKRKTRKGTRSCWECKRRKVKCIPCTHTDAMCKECHRRGAKCISQDLALPEEAPQFVDHHAQTNERMEKVERLLEQLSQDVVFLRDRARSELNTLDNASSLCTLQQGITTNDLRVSGAQPGHVPLPTLNEQFEGITSEDDTPASQITNNHASSPVSNTSCPDKFQWISTKLQAALPSAKDTKLICEYSGGIAIFFHQMLIRSHSHLARDGYKSPEKSAALPLPGTHPVLMARYMLLLATSLQCIHRGQAVGLSENPSEMMSRLIETTSSLVIVNEELIECIEGIECLMLEGFFQANSGNLRRAWLTFRRAMTFAELMGINGKNRALKVLDPTSMVDSKFVWFRLLSIDRYLCLMLGLSRGSPDCGFASGLALAADIPLGQLERKHCIIASQILERNQKGLVSSHDVSKTREIDIEIQKLAQIMPSRWWLPPNMANLASNQNREEVFWEMIRLINQLFHYSLVNQLHLPFMLRASIDPKYIYNRVTCVTSSREVLTRFIAIRSFNKIALCYKFVDFFALTAAMALVLAHVNANQHAGDSFIAHQRLSDRGMVEQVIEILQQLTEHNIDPLPRKSAQLLSQLLEVEKKASEGSKYSTRSLEAEEGPIPPESDLAENVATSNPPNAHLNDDSSALIIRIAHFGTIKIAPAGKILKVSPQTESRDIGFSERETQNRRDDRQTGTRFSAMQPESNLSMHSGTPELPLSHGSELRRGIEKDIVPSTEVSCASDPNLQQQNSSYFDGYDEEWTFQGVDANFFENLMRGLSAHHQG